MKIILIPMLALTGALMLQPVLAEDGPTLFKSKPCAACHSIDTKVVGPALKDVAAKNKGVAGAQETLAKHIKEGTSGNWGPMPMPANPVTEDEAKILAAWVLTLK